MTKIAVAILNWNGAKLFDEFLSSVIMHTPIDQAEIYVIDNASTDNSLEILKEKFPSVKTIVLTENYGYAGGYNKGLKKIEAEYFVLLNSDVEVTPNWLPPIINYLDQNPQIAAAQPKILAYRNKQMFEYAGASGGYIDKYGYPFCRGRIFGVVEEDKSQYNDVADVFWASGACLFIRSKDFFDQDGFDASFFAHMEEIDLCWRLQRAGRGVSCVPQSLVYHLGGATLNEESPQKTYLNFRNNLLMLYKNLSKEKFKKVFRIRKTLDYLAFLQFKLTGKKENAKEIKRAHKDFRIMVENGIVHSLYQDSDSQVKGMYPKSILFDFYFKFKTKFSDINKS